MWVFTEIADWFDKTRADNEKWVDSELQPWVATTLYDDSPWYRNVGIWTASGTLYALNKFTTTVAAGFVDVLRLGDGVQEGGWGYGKDALRLLMVVGPALRGARYVIAGIQELDVGSTALRQAMQAGSSFPDAVRAVPWSGNCGWVAAARLLRLTGNGPLAELSDVARAAGMDVEETGGLKTVTDLNAPLRFLGAPTRTAAVNGMEGVADLLSKNPNSSVMFGVRWAREGKTLGHALVATRNFFGGISILDRSGKMFASLAELATSYRGIENATVDSAALLMDNSLLVRSLGTLPTLGNIVTQAASEHSSDSASVKAETASIPQPMATGTKPAAGATGGQASSASTVTPGTLTVASNTFCSQMNSDVGVTCSTSQTKTYKVGRGEGLSIIALRVYGDASKWPRIASANGIKAPQYMIHPGQILLIP
jgi:hypothetical protein